MSQDYVTPNQRRKSQDEIEWNKLLSRDHERVLAQVREEYGSMAMLLNDLDLQVINELRRDPNVTEFEVTTNHIIQVSFSATKRGFFFPSYDISSTWTFNPSRQVKIGK